MDFSQQPSVAPVVKKISTTGATEGHRESCVTQNAVTVGIESFMGRPGSAQRRTRVTRCTSHAQSRAIISAFHTCERETPLERPLERQAVWGLVDYLQPYSRPFFFSIPF